MTKIISYNVNGIRAAIQKGFISWLADQQADIICIQELKAELDQVDTREIEQLGYSVHWHSAQKKGYSGVAIFSKITPKHVEIGCGIEKYDFEGRVLRLDFDQFSVMSVYMPSGSSGDERQAFKMDWLSDFHTYAQNLKKEIPNLIISGDYNICHRAIDIHNPKGNATSSGFLPEEREWMDSFVNIGFIDTFRFINPDKAHAYSWWSYRAGARGKNLGWRIDYHMASETLKDFIANAYILPDAMHSDHCPIVVELKTA
jgi:exodeoxyribonuclease-3